MTNCSVVAMALVVTVGLAQGCSMNPCTLIGWSEGLTVNLTSEAPLTAGTYRFLIEIPGETLEVALELEAPANTQQGVFVSERIERGNWQVNASLTGSDPYGTSGDITVSRFRGASGGPESLTLTVLQDGTEIGLLELDAISYRRDEINGPGCGTATTASASLEIAPAQ